MPTTIITKNGSGAPADGDLSVGELAVDLTNKQLYTKDSNGVIKIGSSASEGQWTLNGSDIYYDTGNVGIGLDDPDVELEVQSAEPTIKISNNVAKTAGTAVVGQLEFAQHFGSNVSSSIRGLEIGAATDYVSGGLGFFTRKTGGTLTEHVRIDDEGFVGIGTTGPNRKLTINNDSSSIVGIQINRDNTGGGGSSNAIYHYSADGVGRLVYSADDDGEINSIQSNNNFALETGADADLLFRTNGSNTRMHILSNGNVGVNKATPQEKLHVGGDIMVDTGGGAGVLHFGATADQTKIAGRDTSHASYSKTMAFFVNSIQLMELNESRLSFRSGKGVGIKDESATSTFQLGFGYTSPHGYANVFWGQDSAGAGRVDWRKDESVNMILTSSGNLLLNRQASGGGADDGHTLYASGAIYSSMDGTNSTNHYRFYRNGNLVGSINTSGSGTSYVETSDYRVKENVVPLEGALERLNQIPVYRFNYLAAPDETVDGFIAHELAEVVPHAVTGEKDGTETEEYEITPADLDPESESPRAAVMGIREVPAYQGVDARRVVPLLTAAIQEQQVMIETLQAQVAELQQAMQSEVSTQDS